MCPKSTETNDHGDCCENISISMFGTILRSNDAFAEKERVYQFSNYEEGFAFKRTFREEGKDTFSCRFEHLRIDNDYYDST